MNTTPMLSAQDVDKSYGGIHALRGASFELAGGAVPAASRSAGRWDCDRHEETTLVAQLSVAENVSPARTKERR